MNQRYNWSSLTAKIKNFKLRVQGSIPTEWIVFAFDIYFGFINSFSLLKLHGVGTDLLVHAIYLHHLTNKVYLVNVYSFEWRSQIEDKDHR